MKGEKLTFETHVRRAFKRESGCNRDRNHSERVKMEELMQAGCDIQHSDQT